MKKIISIALCFLMVLCLTIPARAAGDVPEAVMQSAKSVVRILSEYSSGSATGSGFVIKNEGGELLIVTNYHVVEDSPYSVSIWIGEEELVEAEILITAPEKDLCILRISEKLNIPAVSLASQEARQGEAVYAVGFPGAADIFSDTAVHTSEEATITDGIISAIRTLTMDDYGDPVKLLQINAAINSGNSGGPLFNVQGQVIGVNTLGVTSAQGVFGAIDVSELRSLLEDNDIVLSASPAITEQEEAQMDAQLPEPPGKNTAGILLGAAFGAAAAVVAVLMLLKNRKKEKTVTLRTLMEQYPQGMGAEKAVALLLPVLIQLRDLHNNGKLHLQISPDSIQISPKTTVLREPSGQETERFCTGFAAPEIYKGSGYSITTDIYSFAAVLCYAVSGKLPTNSLQQEQVEADLMALWEDVPAFEAVLHKAMAAVPQDRTPSVQELIYQLSSFNTQPYRIPEEDWKKAAGTTAGGNKIWLIAGSAAVVVLMTAAVLTPGWIRKNDAYQYAQALLEANRYDQAVVAFTELGSFKDSQEKIFQAKYAKAAALLEKKSYDDAIAVFRELGDYSDSVQQITYAEKERDYDTAMLLLEDKSYEAARDAFAELGDYKDAAGYLARFREEYMELTQVGELNGLKEYELTYVYENGQLMKEVCEYTADADSNFYGFSMKVDNGQDTGVFTSAYTRNPDGTAKKLNIFNNAKTLVQTRLYSYDSEGRRSKESYDYKNNSSSKDATYVYTYDDRGNKTSRMWYQNLTGSGTPYHKEYYEYDEQGNLTRQYYKYNWYFYSSSSSGEYLYRNEYDEQGQIIRHISTKDNAYSYEYEYDEKGNMTVKRQIKNDKYGGYAKGTLTTEYLYEYDEFGNLIRQTNNYLSSGSVRIVTHTYGNVLIFE